MNAIDYLFSLDQFGIKFGLDNISTLVERLGHPERAFKTVHIAGTNGKGSVTAMVDAALRAAGHHSARFTSPHLVDVAERFVIDGRSVSHDALASAIDEVRAAIDALRHERRLAVQPTFFEVTTAVAFELFRRAKVDVAVLEVGLGGRLDATNVVSPIATAITSIAFDHELYLGATLRDIATEKAGIIKPGVPVVVGDLAPDAFGPIAAIARERGAELIRAAAADADGFVLGLPGAHQRMNAAVAVNVLRVVDRAGLGVARDAIAAGLAHPGWPGRLDWRRFDDGRELLLDAAHNPAGAAALASYLKCVPAANASAPPKPPLVFAAMRDKDIRHMLDALLPAVGALVATRASTARSAEPPDIVALARAIAPDVPAFAAATVAEALAHAWQISPRIVVAGSIFLLGDVLRETRSA